MIQHRTQHGLNWILIIFGITILTLYMLTDCALIVSGSGVTTMGSDRENPGAPNPNGGPPGLGDRAKTLARASEFCKISPQSPGNGISETLDSKIFRVSMPWTPRKLVHIYGARLMHLALRLGGLRKF